MAKSNKVAKWCASCHQISWGEVDSCSSCKESNLTDVTPEESELVIYSRVAHNNATAGYHKLQNGLCYVVLGSIISIIGVLFIFLSTEKKYNVNVGINPSKPQFTFSMIFLGVGGILLIIGAIITTLAVIKRNKAKKDIAYISAIRKENRK